MQPSEQMGFILKSKTKESSDEENRLGSTVFNSDPVFLPPDCDAKHWGPGCRQDCRCENGALCDPLTGACQCPPGFIGLLCEDPCPAGTHGRGCLQICKCKNGASCDKSSGECTCLAGFTGTL